MVLKNCLQTNSKHYNQTKPMFLENLILSKILKLEEKLEIANLHGFTLIYVSNLFIIFAGGDFIYHSSHGRFSSLNTKNILKSDVLFQYIPEFIHCTKKSQELWHSH